MTDEYVFELWFVRLSQCVSVCAYCVQHVCGASLSVSVDAKNLMATKRILTSIEGMSHRHTQSVCGSAI